MAEALPDAVAVLLHDSELQHIHDLSEAPGRTSAMGEVRAGKAPAPAACHAVAGADRVRRSGLEPGTGMAESGRALAYVLNAYQHTGAAGRVRDANRPA